MRRAAGLVVGASAWALVACASHGSASSAVPRTPGANATGNTSGTAARDEHFKPPPDYRRVVVNGEEKFCRKFYATGTRAESTTECLTETELKDRENSNSLMLEEAQRMRAATPGGTGPAGLGH